MKTISRSSGRDWLSQAFAPVAGLPGRFLLTIEAWAERGRLRHELAHLHDEGELGRTLTDAGIAISDVPRLMRAHPGTLRQFAGMMERLGIDRAALPRTAAVAETVREMEWRCGSCTDWRTCRAWLAGRDPSASYRAFCPNAATLDALRCAETTEAGSSFGERCGVLAELETASTT